VRRRDFITLGAVVAGWPLAARAQQSKLPVIGFLSASTLESYKKFVDSFRRGLSEVGYVEGRNVTIEYRVAEDRPDLLPTMAAELVHRGVAVIATFSNLGAALAAKAATQSIPIVFVTGADPVGSKLVTNLARPDANITGVTVLDGELFLKRLTLLRELVPSVPRIGYLVNYSNPGYSKDYVRTNIVRARILGVELLPVNASNEGEIAEAFAGLAQQQAGALVVGADAFLLAQRDRLVALAAHHRIPTSYSARDFVEIGGLISYSSDHAEGYRQAGVYVGRILKGEKPADLPVLQPTKFELVINLKTAKAH
jgi:putative tryptophan/tyrosine transport system substrate-binding protein